MMLGCPSWLVSLGQDPAAETAYVNDGVAPTHFAISLSSLPVSSPTPSADLIADFSLSPDY
jgi:hypothetical protein